MREALIDYAPKQGVTAIRGSRHKVRMKFDEKVKFPSKGEPDRGNLDGTIMRAGKWQEVSQLDTAARSPELSRKVRGTRSSSTR